jgi:RNA-directed DNA polymerase
MATSPFFARPIKEWLKAGVVDHAIFKPIHEGTPQGGVRSPLLANIALHGMEEVARRAGGPEFPCFNGKQIHQRTTCIRYADGTPVQA